MKAGTPSSPTDFDGCRRRTSLRTSESQTDAVGTESADWKSVEKSQVLWLLKTLFVKYVAKAFATSRGWGRRFPSVSSSVGVSVVFPETRHVFPTMHRICLEVVISTFKPVEFIVLHGCFDKPTIWGKFVIVVSRPIFLKTPVEVILFPCIIFEILMKACRKFTRFNLLKTKRNLLYIWNQSLPRSKHIPPRL